MFSLGGGAQVECLSFHAGTASCYFALGACLLPPNGICFFSTGWLFFLFILSLFTQVHWLLFFLFLLPWLLLFFLFFFAQFSPCSRQQEVPGTTGGNWDDRSCLGQQKVPGTTGGNWDTDLHLDHNTRWPGMGIFCTGRLIIVFVCCVALVNYCFVLLLFFCHCHSMWFLKICRLAAQCFQFLPSLFLFPWLAQCHRMVGWLFLFHCRCTLDIFYSISFSKPFPEVMGYPMCWKYLATYVLPVPRTNGPDG